MPLIQRDELRESSRRRMMQDMNLSSRPSDDEVRVWAEGKLRAIMREQNTAHGKTADLLPGGVGDGKKPGDFDPKELEKGRKDEREHTNRDDVATEIAMDHLTKDPRYYSKHALFPTPAAGAPSSGMRAGFQMGLARFGGGAGQPKAPALNTQPRPAQQGTPTIPLTPSMAKKGDFNQGLTAADAGKNDLPRYYAQENATDFVNRAWNTHNAWQRSFTELQTDPAAPAKMA